MGYAINDYGYLLGDYVELHDADGHPLTGGYIEVYVDGTQTKYTTFANWDFEENPFRVPLDNIGSCVLIARVDLVYRLHAYNKNGTQVWSRENVKVAVSGDISVTPRRTVVDCIDNNIDIVTRSDANNDYYTLSLSKAYLDAAQTSVSEGSDNVHVSSSVKADGHTDYSVSVDAPIIPEQMQSDWEQTDSSKADFIKNKPIIGDAVNITSNNGSVSITTSSEAGTKTFDLSVNASDAIWGVFGEHTAGTTPSNAALNVSYKMAGNMELPTNSKFSFSGCWHVDIEFAIQINTPVATEGLLELMHGLQFTHRQSIDASNTGTQYTHLSFDISDSTAATFVCRLDGCGTDWNIRTCYMSVHKVQGASGGSSGGPSDHKVSVTSNASAGYLADVLVADSDEITLSPIGNQLRLGINLSGESDPKLSTMPESAINASTSNYGSYALASGYDKLIWGNRSSFTWLNAIVFQSMRLSEAQGTISKCNIALTGNLSGDKPCLNIGVFNTTGTLLGQTGLKFYGTDFNEGVELCCFDMREEFTGSLQLKRNTRYYIQVWSCGVQLAGQDRNDIYNYNYDFILRQNLQTTISDVSFVDVNDFHSTISTIPFVSLGAADLSREA